MLYRELMLHIATHYIPKLQIYIQLRLTSMKTDKKIALDNSTAQHSFIITDNTKLNFEK